MIEIFEVKWRATGAVSETKRFTNLDEARKFKKMQDSHLRGYGDSTTLFGVSVFEPGDAWEQEYPQARWID